MRNSIVIVAEGAHDSENNPITSDDVRAVLEDKLGEDTRVTILGRPARRDAERLRPVDELSLGSPRSRRCSPPPRTAPQVIGVRGNRVHPVPLEEAVARTHKLADKIAARDFDTAQTMRGEGFIELARLFESISRALPTARAEARQSRIAVLNVGGLAAGMNAAARAAVRLGLHRGHTMLGVHGSFRGLVEGDVQELRWGRVRVDERGGARLGISRHVPTVEDLYADPGGA